MLINLKLKNIALIEIIEINFEKGLNIITGDSGSGKSLIVDSLNALFGGTALTNAGPRSTNKFVNSLALNLACSSFFSLPVNLSHPTKRCKQK